MGKKVLDSYSLCLDSQTLFPVFRTDERLQPGGLGFSGMQVCSAFKHVIYIEIVSCILNTFASQA
jgi:hypothetical protein